jgi:hypothetical protein
MFFYSYGLSLRFLCPYTRQSAAASYASHLILPRDNPNIPWKEQVHTPLVSVSVSVTLRYAGRSSTAQPGASMTTFSPL